MTSHGNLRARHQLYHSHGRSFQKLSGGSPTLLGRTTEVQLVQRATSTNGESSGGGISPTIPIAVGVCVPIVVIIVTFILLHRRHVKRIKAEERLDPHKSLDFGMGGKSRSSAGTKTTTENEFEKSIRRGRGLSMDLGSPYVLPPELHNSRESLNSLSRNIVHDMHDPYRPVTAFFNSAPNSARNSTSHDDSASIKTQSTMRGHRPEGAHSPLVPNAQRMPFSSSPIALQPISPQQSAGQEIRSQSKSPLSSPPMQEGAVSMDNFVPPPPAAHLPEERKKSLSPKPQDIPQQPEELPVHAISPQTQTSSVPQIHYPDDKYHDDYYDESHYVEQPVPEYLNVASPQSELSERFYTPTEEAHGYMDHQPHVEGLGVSEIPFDNRRISVLRPLPPDDPADTPQQRAQRIRSFYKEYFNEHDARVYQQGPNDYYEDYNQEYLGDGALYDAGAGQFIVGQAPYAAPITRRAMTPPPRGPPRFNSSSRHNSGGFSPKTQNRARAFSTASAGVMRGREPKRHAPPPAPLRTLPTPHLLKEDAFTLAADFAPPTRIRDQAAGRAASPRMEPRHFSPQVAIASPLASSFNELASMPSPHHLRRSGTFTALDFAPPPRFRDKDSGSDAGSIRSGRSGRSNYSTSSRMQVQNIRAGTYRVSRIPKELVGTSNEFAELLKPTWKVGS